MSVYRPSGWREVPLGSIAMLERSIVDASAIAPGTLYVGLENITSAGLFHEVKPTENVKITSSKFTFDKKHILYGKLRPYLRKIAAPNFVGVCSTDILPIAPQVDIVDRKYLFYYLRQQHLVDLATARSSGANLPRVSPNRLLELPVMLPSSVGEQRRIAAILDKADAIHRKRHQSLAEADALLRAAYLELVGYRHPHYTHWPIVCIEELAAKYENAMRTGPFGSDLLHSEFVSEGVAVLGIDNAVQNRFSWDERRFITPEKYERLRRYRVHPGDVIITIMGTTGRSAVVPADIPEAITTKHLATITPDKHQTVPEFLSFAIHSDPLVIRQIIKANKGAIMAGLNLGIIKKLELRLPPLRQQQHFAEALRCLLMHQDRLRDPLVSGKALFGSLSQRAFRGEL